MMIDHAVEQTGPRIFRPGARSEHVDGLWMTLMPTIKRGSVVLLVMLAVTWACSDSEGTVSSPSRSPSRAITFSLSGQVTDAVTAAPIAGAVVSIGGRNTATTDNSGNYSFAAGALDGEFTYVSAENYVSDYHYIRGTIQNVHLYRIERIVAGASTLATIAPDDTLCVNNVQDSPGLGPDYVCRSVFVMAPNDGSVTIEALSTQDGARPVLEVETVGVSPCCSERIGNPTTIQVTAGTTIVIHVEMPSSSTSAQSFVVNTSPSPQ